MTKAVLVCGDAGALLVALSNLLDNALRYASPAGKVTLAVEETAHEVRVHVDDTGPGVPPEQRDAIFAPYTRGNEVLGDGAGLGLETDR